MSPELTVLFDNYVKELRDAKKRAEAWYNNLVKAHTKDPNAPNPKRLWPMGAASHPWVIATVRKFWFLCIELNERERSLDADSRPLEEEAWGQEESASDAEYGPIPPKVFIYDLLSGTKTDDLYKFVQFLCFVPIGVQNDEDV
jgi:hypothetical protein